MEILDGLTNLLKALALVGFAGAAFLIAYTVFDLRPKIGNVLDRIAKSNSAGVIKRMLRRALKDEEDSSLIDLTPRKVRQRRRKVTHPPELPAP